MKKLFPLTKQVLDGDAGFWRKLQMHIQQNAEVRFLVCKLRITSGPILLYERLAQATESLACICERLICHNTKYRNNLYQLSPSHTCAESKPKVTNLPEVEFSRWMITVVRRSDTNCMLISSEETAPAMSCMKSKNCAQCFSIVVSSLVGAEACRHTILIMITRK